MSLLKEAKLASLKDKHQEQARQASAVVKAVKKDAGEAKITKKPASKV